MSAPIAVFASGGGTNLAALLEHFGARGVDAGTIRLVVSDRADAGALDRARRAGVEARVIEPSDRSDDDVALEMLAALEEAEIEVVALAGYLRLIPERVVRRYHGRILNIHPALLPAFGGRGMYGKRIHAAVLEAGCRVTGVSVHLVDEEYDTGPLLFQWPVPVYATDDADALAERVLRVEHRVYPAAVEAVARAAATGARAGVFDFAGPAVFRLTEALAPEEAEVRNALGLPPRPDE